MPHRVVVIDDERGLADALSIRLNAAGVAAQPAYGGTAGLAAVRAVHPDAIVLDMRMPDMDGVALWRAIAGHDASLAARMLFVTGDTLSPGASSFLAEQRGLVLDKPFTAKDLRERVDEPRGRTDPAAAGS